MEGLAKQVYELLAELPPASAQVVGAMLVNEAMHYDLGDLDVSKAYLERELGDVEDLKRSILRRYVSKRMGGDEVDSVVALAKSLGQALAAGEELKKDYDPNEHRNKRGEWTSGTAFHRTDKQGNRVRRDTADTVAILGRQSRVFGEPHTGQSDTMAFVPGVGRAQRVGQAAQFLNGTVGGYLPPSARTGLAVGGLVGQHAQQAQMAFGPAIDRAKYRYQGIETKVDPELLQAAAQVKPRKERDRTAELTRNVRAAEQRVSEASKKVAKPDFDKPAPVNWDTWDAPEGASAATKQSYAERKQKARSIHNARVAVWNRYEEAETARANAQKQLNAAKQALKEYTPPQPDADYKFSESRQRILEGRDVPGRGGKLEHQDSAMIAWFKNHLPKQNLSHLQRLSGHQPGSQGVIIDAKGNIATQMIGRGDDWYLPFDLNNLGALKGGHYIRTRTNGGLTTEDLYTGLMSGARGMTVVSHNGVYTMQFDDSLRGSRRYSQAAREMTDHYGKLLDAVKAGRVRVNTVYDLDKDRVSELRAQAGGNPDVFEALMDNEKENPTPSGALQRQWGLNFLTDEAEKVKGPSTLSADEWVDEQVVPVLVQRALRGQQIRDDAGNVVVDLGDNRNPAELIAAAKAQVDANPRVAAEVLGKGKQYDDYIRNATHEYRTELQPIQLNGPGYDYAMQALAEQYPYFIKSVKYYPGQRGLQDKGYVAPRYNRSADVMAGYFDPNITGYGKIPASRTRYQNARVTNTIETGYRPASAREGFQPGRLQRVNISREPDVAPQGEDTPSTPPSDNQIGFRSTGDKPKKGDKKSLKRRDADLALIKAALEQKTISPDWKPKDVGLKQFADKDSGLDQRGQAVATQYAANDSGGRNWAYEHPDYSVFSLPYESYEKMDDDKLHAAAKKFHRLITDEKFVKVHPDLLVNHHNDGSAPSIDSINPLSFPADSTKDFDFGHEDYKEGHNAAHYSRTYREHEGVVKAGREAGVTGISDNELPKKIATYITTQQAEGRAAQAGDDKQGVETAKQKIKNALLAHQLHRFFLKANPGPVLGGQGSVDLAGGPAGAAGGSSGSAMSYGQRVLSALYPISLN